MPAVAFFVYARRCGGLAALCCAGWGQAQEVAPPFALTTAPQATDGLTDARVSLTAWPGLAHQAGVGLGLALPSTGVGRTVGPLDLGLHWRSADQGQGRVHIGVWQQMRPGPDPGGIAGYPGNYPSNYTTRLEMQFTAASARGIQFELGGALGLQLNSNERVVLRLSKGRPTVYYRVRF